MVRVKASDVANMMLYMGSDQASFVNGQIMNVDMGLSVTSSDYDDWENSVAIRE
jgi:enoyl-[acyl-carrier-protein] reductase (NADH)